MNLIEYGFLFGHLTLLLENLCVKSLLCGALSFFEKYARFLQFYGISVKIKENTMRRMPYEKR